MAELLLTHGKKTMIDDADLPTVQGYKWRAFQHRGSWYAVANIRLADGRRSTLRLHRLLMDAPADVLIDHKDGDGLNNRRDNLRVASNGQNRANDKHRRNGQSGFKGVRCKASGSFQAQLTHEKVAHYLGTFERAEDAARAYDRAARQYHGAFANLNFPDEV